VQSQIEGQQGGSAVVRARRRARGERVGGQARVQRLTIGADAAEVGGGQPAVSDKHHDGSGDLGATASALDRVERAHRFGIARQI
jgi:hypothetical protein